MMAISEVTNSYLAGRVRMDRSANQTSTDNQAQPSQSRGGLNAPQHIARSRSTHQARRLEEMTTDMGDMS